MVVHDSISFQTDLKTVYNSQTLTSTLYTADAQNWINVEIQAHDSTAMNVYAWDLDYTRVDPTVVHEHSPVVTWADTTLILHQHTAGTDGVYLAEVRVYELDMAQSLGYYKFYRHSYPYPDTMIEYTRITEGSLIQNQQNGTHSSTSYATVGTFDVYLCDEG